MNAADLTFSLMTPIAEVPTKDGWQIQKEWLQSFASRYKEKHGKWDQKYRWEYFSQAERIIRGAKAVEVYNSISDPGFFIWTQETLTGDRIFKGMGKLPDIAILQKEFTGKEIVLFNQEINWCLFFTHEDGGYFQPPGFVEKES